MTGTVAPVGSIVSHPIPLQHIKPAFKGAASNPEAVLILPDSDGEPMENERERIQIHLCIDSLYQYWAHRQDFFAAGNTFLYYSVEV